MVFSTQEFFLFTQEIIHFTHEILPLLHKKLQTPYSRNLRVSANNTRDRSGLNFLTFVLHLRKTSKKLNLEVDQIEDRTRTPWVTGNDVIHRPAFLKLWSANHLLSSRSTLVVLQKIQKENENLIPYPSTDFPLYSHKDSAR